MSILTEQAGLEINEQTLREYGWRILFNASRRIDIWVKRIRTVHFEMPVECMAHVRVFQFGHDSIYFDTPDTIIELEGMCNEYYKRYTGFGLA